MTDHRLEILLRGTDHTPESELRERLLFDRPLRVKYGIDPTSPSVHLGHTVPLRRLAEFQNLGHKAVLIIGDYTASIGDPTGRNEMRPRLSRAQIERNAETYLKQIGKVIDVNAAEVRYNSEWFDRFTMSDTIELMALFTSQKLLSRQDFSVRMATETPVYTHELLYPILQAYDSMRIDADVELGGTEQKFNLLLGREYQGKFNKPQQVCIMLPILRGLDGVKKMGKSLNNYIGVSESPDEMYGKVMSIPDTLLPEWFCLLTNLQPAPTDDHMTSKKRLARTIVTDFHDAANAEAAEARWIRRYSQRQDPEEIEEREFNRTDLSNGQVSAHVLVHRLGFAVSKSQARTLVKEGAVNVGPDRTRLTDPMELLTIADGLIVRVGKHKIARLRVKDE